MNSQQSKNENKIHKIRGAHFRIKELTNPQSEDNAQVAQLKREFAEHPSAGLTPAKLANITLEAERGNLMAQSDLAEDMEEKDSHIFAELAKRKNALLTVPWSIVPPRNASDAEKKDAELIEEIFRDGNFIDDTIFDMADGILKGFSNLELTWQRRDGLWVPEQIEHRPARWFMVHPEEQNVLRLRDQSFTGAELRPFNWIQHQHKSKSGYIGRANLIRILSWPYLFKNYSVRDLAEFLEIYGIPARIGKYPTGAGTSEKASLLQAIMSIGHNSGGIIPKGMDIEFAQAAGGQGDPFEIMISWCERSQSKAILGGTLTSQADGKSSTNALGNVHNEGRIELRNSDCRQIANTLTRDLVKATYILNGKSYQNDRRFPRFEFDIQEPEDLKLFSESLPTLVDYGFQIPVAWAQNKVQIPLAEKGEAVMMAQQPPLKVEKANPETQPQAKLKTMAITKLAALKAKSTKALNQDTADLFTHQLADSFSPVLQGFNDDVEALINDATSIEELQEQLSTMDLSIDEASEVLQLALVASELGGMADIEDGQ
jgi:phage gp29-like protein